MAVGGAERPGGRLERRMARRGRRLEVEAGCMIAWSRKGSGAVGAAGGQEGSDDIEW